MALVLGDTQHTARKRHYCDSCGGMIEPGQPYRRSRIVDGGEAWVYKSHLPCHEASMILWEKGFAGDDNALLNVCDMYPEDRRTVFEEDPETYHAVWPDAPEPGRKLTPVT